MNAFFGISQIIDKSGWLLLMTPGMFPPVTSGTLPSRSP